MSISSRAAGVRGARKGSNGIVMAIEGGKQAAADLARFNLKIQKAAWRQAIAYGMTPVRKAARRNAPVDSGDTAKSIKTKHKSYKSGTVISKTSATTPHAHLTELGTEERVFYRPHYAYIKSLRGGEADLGMGMGGSRVSLVFVTHSGKVEAQNWMGKAMNDNANEAVQRISRHYGRRVEAEARNWAKRAFHGPRAYKGR